MLIHPFCLYRCQHAVNQKLPIDPAIDGGTWYDLKAASKLGPSPANEGPQPKDEEWRDFPQCGIPMNFNTGHIYHHIIESVQENSDEENERSDCQTAKPLRRGRQLFESRNVTSMQDFCQGNLYRVKAKVLGSMRKILYTVVIALSKHTGFVQNASCECKASSLGRCSHVAAVLFAINDCKDSGSNESCTSKPCTWNVGRKVGKNPKCITDTQYPNRKRKMSSVINFDPRPTLMRSTSVTHEERNNFVRELQTASYPGSSMWQTIIPMHYNDYSLSSDERDLLRQKVGIICGNLMPSVYGITELCPEQGNEAWFAERRLRVTASIAKSVVTASSNDVKANLVKGKLWESPVKAASLEYGHANEAKARQSFEEKFPNLTVRESGLWVNSEYPFLAASPDGLLYDIDLDSHGVLEIKCPMSLKATHPKNFSKALSKKQMAAFCLTEDGGEVKLNTKHAYYYQVQMQMGVLQRAWCFFVVWSPEGMIVNKIVFDKDFFDAMVPVLKDFHCNYLCPEYVEMKLPRHLPILNLK